MEGILEKQWNKNDLKLRFYDILPSDEHHKRIPGDVFQKIVQSYDPQLLEYLLERENFYEYLMNFTKSVACWSIFGYIIGLGDRHLDNILLSNDFKMIHVFN